MNTSGGSYLDLETWVRREHFEFFRKYEQPFFNITAHLDATALWERSRADESLSFSIGYHYCALKVANDIESFRHRIRDDGVWVCDRIHGGTTVLLEDKTFTFCYFDFEPDFALFQAGARASFDEARSGTTPFDPKDERDDLIHFTALPWVAFTGVQHPRRPIPGDSVPKIAFGKCHEVDGAFRLPVAIDVHHALVDGLQVGDFFRNLEANLSNPLF